MINRRQISMQMTNNVHMIMYEESCLDSRENLI